MADATATSLAAFLDPEKWDIIDHDVPIFTEHAAYMRKGKDGSVQWKTQPIGARHPGDDWELAYEVDEDVLKKIAANINKSLDESSCVIKLFEGHTQPAGKVPQSQQPKLIGYGVGAKFGRFGNAKKPAVMLRDQYIRKGCGEIAKELPERSAEYNFGTKEIRSVAMIKTDPRLNMGMTIYHDLPNQVVCYGVGVDQMPDPTTMPPSAEEKKKKEEERGHETPEENEDDSPVSEGDKKVFMKYMKTCYPEAHAKYGMGAAAAPSGTNGTLPGMAGMAAKRPPNMPPAPSSEDPQRMAKEDDDTIRFQRQQELIDTQDLKKTVEELKKKDLRRSCEHRVSDLRFKGKDLGTIAQREELVVRFMNMESEDDRNRYQGEIEQRWNNDPCSPTGGFNVAYEDVVRGTSSDHGPQPTSMEVGSMVQYCEKNKIDFDSDEGYMQAHEWLMRQRVKPSNR